MALAGWRNFGVVILAGDLKDALPPALCLNIWNLLSGNPKHFWLVSVMRRLFSLAVMRLG